MAAFGPLYRAPGQFQRPGEYADYLRAEATRRAEEWKFWEQLRVEEERYKATIKAETEMFETGLEAEERMFGEKLGAEKEMFAEELGLKEEELALRKSMFEWEKETWEREFAAEEERWGEEFGLKETLALTEEGKPRGAAGVTITDRTGVPEREKFEWLKGFREKEQEQMWGATKAATALAGEKPTDRAPAEKRRIEERVTPPVESGKVDISAFIKRDIEAGRIHRPGGWGATPEDWI